MEQSIHPHAYQKSPCEAVERCDRRVHRPGRGLPPPRVAVALRDDAKCVDVGGEHLGAASRWSLTWVVQAL